MSEFSPEGLKAKNAAALAAVLAPADTQTTTAPRLAEAPAVQAAAAPSKTPRELELEAELERMKHSHSVLQGKYNAEVPRLQKQLKELAPAKQPPAAIKANPGLPPEKLREIDDDVILLATNAATSAAEQVAQEARMVAERLELLEQERLERSKQQRFDQFAMNLERLHSDADGVIRSEAFRKWVDETGRGSILEQFWGAPEGVPAWADTLTAFKYTQGQQSTPVPPPGSTLPNISTRPGAAPTQVGGYSADEVREFFANGYRKVLTGEMSRDAFEAKKRQITAAMEAGKVF